MNTTELQSIKVSPSTKFYLDNCLIPLIKRIDSTSVEENIIDILFDFPSLGISLNSVASWAYKFTSNYEEKDILEATLKHFWTNFNPLKTKSDINYRIGKIQEFWDKYKNVSGSYWDKERAVEFLEQLIDKLPSEYEFKKIAEWVRFHTLILNDNDWKFDVVIPLVKELKSAKNKATKKSIEAETTQPLKEPEGYSEETTESKQQGEIISDGDIEYTYQENAVRELYNHGGRYAAIDGILYKFNGQYYERLIPELEKRRIRQWATETPVYDPQRKKYVYRYLNPKSINAIWEWALMSFGVDAESVNPPGINLANGVLRFKWEGRKVEWKLEDHNPDYIYTYCSSVSYNEKADSKDCDRLLECLDPAPRTAILRQIAAAFDLPNVRKLFSRGIRAGIARGAGSNGKDSLKEAVSLIFGSKVVSVTLSDFKAYDEGRKFYLAKLKHAAINWPSENNKQTSLDGLDSLNICVTGDKGLDIEEKNKQPRQIQPQSIHIFNVNKLPRMTSGLDSILSRFVVYDFNKTFKHNPDPLKGELKADPRFHDDPEFMVNNVCPALLNRLLAELQNLAIHGIDYDSLKDSLSDIQEESTHLWTFVKDMGIKADAKGKIYISDLWEHLKKWYQDNGTLEIIELENGKTKNIWHEQANKYDANVTGANQVFKRFKTLFPKIDRDRETKVNENMGRFYLEGISIKDSASVASEAYEIKVSASVVDSDCFSSSYSASEEKKEKTEAKTEPEKKSLKQGTLDMRSTEAPEAKNEVATVNNSVKWIEVKDPTVLSPGQIVADKNDQVFKLVKKLRNGWMAEGNGTTCELINWEIVWLREEITA